MKKVLIAALILSLVLCLTACGGSNKKDIVGTWHIVDEETATEYGIGIEFTKDGKLRYGLTEDMFRNLADEKMSDKEWDEAMADAKYKFLKENKNSKDLMYRLTKADIEKDVIKTEYERDHPGDKKKMTIAEATKAIDRADNSLGVEKDDLIDFLLDNNIIVQSNKKK